MKSVTVCPYCLSTEGLKGSELEEKGFKTDEVFMNHLEEVHDLVVRRSDETEEDALARVKMKNPRVGTVKCRCPGCLNKRGEDSRPAIADILRSQGEIKL